MNLEALYQSRCEALTDMARRLPLLYQLTIEQQAQMIIELGVRGGESTIAFLAALERTGGHLWSCDLIHPNEIETVEKPILLVAEKIDHWSFNVGDDRQLIDNAPKACDILFINTDHEYEHTLWELRNYSPSVKPNGVIILHDTDLEGVNEAIETWMSETPEWEIYQKHTGYHGLTVLGHETRPR